MNKIIIFIFNACILLFLIINLNFTKNFFFPLNYLLCMKKLPNFKLSVCLKYIEKIYYVANHWESHKFFLR